MACLSHRWKRRAASLVLIAWTLSGVCDGGWIDPDTPEANLQTTGFKGDDEIYDLVFSDEFNKEGRKFDDGHDPKWTSIHKNDYTNAALHFYSKEATRTHKGKLVISTTNDDVTFRYRDEKTKRFTSMSKQYISGMLQSWNKFCFTGGIVEVSASLPGEPFTGGLWPAIWLLGNLARATYTSSSDFIWPWSYNKCDRSTKERKDWQFQQETSACDRSVHYGFHRNTGRGAPEIDILEAMAGLDPYDPYVVGKPYVSHSFQVAPGTADNRPANGMWPDPGTWYEDGLEYGADTSPNLYFWGTQLKHKPAVTSYWADAISANHRLNYTHFEHQHIYRVEWQPGEEGYIRWYLDGAFVFGMTQETLDKNGAIIPLEPMYLLFNTAVSTMWGFPAPCPENSCPCDCWDAREPKCACALPDGMEDQFPATFNIDFVRVYQNVNDSTHTLGCNTRTMPSDKWIRGHSDRYKDPMDKDILKSIRHGGGRCKTDQHCGAPPPRPPTTTEPPANAGRRALIHSKDKLEAEEGGGHGGSGGGGKGGGGNSGDGGGGGGDDAEGALSSSTPPPQESNSSGLTSSSYPVSYPDWAADGESIGVEEGGTGIKIGPELNARYGTCVQERCVCVDGYTGPHCLTPDGFDDEEWVQQEGVLPPMEEPAVPLNMAACAAILFGTLVMTCLVRLSHRKSRRKYVLVDSSLLTVPALPPAAVPPGYGRHSVAA